MTFAGFQLREFRVEGEGVDPAVLQFVPGLNVLSGASDTGKSYIVDCLDYMLGGATLPRSIPESAGYAVVALTIEAADRRRFRLERSLQGGEFRLFTLPEAADSTIPCATTLAARHASGSDENISAFLLDLCDLKRRRIRKNRLNETQNLSFRNLSHLVLIDEQSIIKKGSPVHSGESTQRTVENSAFKLLLTGIDDSSLVPSRRRDILGAEQGAQRQLLDDLIEQYQAELAEMTDAPHELSDQLERLAGAIQESEGRLATQRGSYVEFEDVRRSAWRRLTESRNRAGEIDALLERFDLLHEQYASDLRRLEAIAETGNQFLLLEADRCPLCGAPPGEHFHDGMPGDSDIEALSQACAQEADKLRLLQKELDATVTGLRFEQTELVGDIVRIRLEYEDADSRLRDVAAPALAQARGAHTDLVNRRAEVREALSLVSRVDDLVRKRQAIDDMLSERAKRRKTGRTFRRRSSKRSAGK